MKHKPEIPVYSLDKFKSKNKHNLYEVELFDANRHFQVSYPHKHDFYEVLYLSNGSGYHLIDSNKYEIKPPCIFFMSPGQAHRLELSKDIEGYIFIFTSEFYLLNQKNKNRLLEFPFFYSIGQDNPPIYLKDNDENFYIKSLLKHCSEVALTKDNEFVDEMARSTLDLVLLTCNGLYPSERNPIQKGKGHILVKNFLQLVEQNYNKNLRITDYAEMLAITPNHLTQMVKQVMGKTSVEILQRKTVIEIKRLLIHTNLSIAEISDYMNFPDQSYFTKYFKKISGVSPMAYRKKHEK